MSDQYDDELNRFWNELDGRRTSAAQDFDSGDAAIIRRLQSLAAAPVPSAARERVWRGLEGTYESSTAGVLPVTDAGFSITPDASPRRNGRVHARPYRSSARPGPGWLHQPILRYAAVAILVLAIVLAIDIVRPDREPDGHLGGAPAIQAPATPSPGAVDGTVFEFTVPVADLPTTDWVRTVFDHLSIPPGTTAAGSSNCCSGPMIEYVLSGAYTIRAAAAIEVIRGTGKVEHLPPNTEVTLGPGDSLISRSETTVQITVTGPQPAELLNWILVDHSRDPAKHEEHVLGSWIVRRDDTKNPLTSIPRAPLTVQIRRVVMQNGNAVPAPVAGLQLVMPIDDGSFVTHASDGSTQVFGKDEQPVTTYLLTMTQPGAPPGTPVP